MHCRCWRPRQQPRRSGIAGRIGGIFTFDTTPTSHTVMQQISEDIQYLFDQHLQGNLSEAELSEFNQRLTNDPGLAQQWSEFQMLTAGLKQQFAKEKSTTETDLRNRIALAAAELETDGFFVRQKAQAPKAKIVQMSPAQRYLALAAALTLVLAAVWFFNSPSDPGAEQLFAKNFQVEQNQLAATLDELEKYSLGEPDAERRQALATALGLVEKKQFAEAIPLLKNWIATDTAKTPTTASDLATARYFLAQALMATGNTGEETQLLLVTLTTDQTFSSPNDARWHLALCHLKNNRLDSARPLLQSVLSSKSTHAPEAAKLLQQIH